MKKHTWTTPDGDECEAREGGTVFVSGTSDPVIAALTVCKEILRLASSEKAYREALEQQLKMDAPGGVEDEDAWGRRPSDIMRDATELVAWIRAEKR